MDANERFRFEKKFWLANEEHIFGSTTIALFFYLLNVNNSCFWKKQFKRNNLKIQSELDISYRMLLKARVCLKKYGFIDFISENGNANVSYTLTPNFKISDEVNDEVNDEVQSRSVTSKIKLNSKTKHKTNTSFNNPKPLSGDLVDEKKVFTDFQPLEKDDFVKNKEDPPDSAAPPQLTKKDLMNEVIEIFKRAYEQHRGIEYSITNVGKERNAASKLINLYCSMHPESDSHQALNELEQFISLCLTINDNWLYNNMSLSTIINHFNSITLKLNGHERSNRKFSSKNPATTNIQLAQSIIRGLGIKGQQFN